MRTQSKFTVADTFETALAALRGHPFAAVVTAHRLGTHNGLHLVLHVSNERPGATAVVTTPAPDPVLEREASAFGALTAVAPWRDPAPLIVVLKGPGAVPA